MGDGVKEVGAGLLWHCNSLKTITLGAGIRIIRNNDTNWPLGSCKNLTRLYNRNPNPISIDEAVLQEVNYSYCVLYVPQGSADLYRNAPVWQRFVHIKEFDPNVPTNVIEGDVNLDGEINIADVNTLVDLILSSDQCIVDADTDVNQDGEINIADINAVINMILSGE